MLHVLALALASVAAAGETPPRVVFVCERGTVKSVIAAEIFNRRAAERKLAFRAVSRGVSPDPAIPAAVAENLAKDGFDVADFQAAKLAAEDVRGAAHVVAIGVETPLLDDAKAVTRWTDIPPASTHYAAARDAMAKRVDALLDELVNAPAPAHCH